MVLDGLCIPERFKDRIRFEDLPLELSEFLLPRSGEGRGRRQGRGQGRLGVGLSGEEVEGGRRREGIGRDRGEVLDHFFRVLRLACARLATGSEQLMEISGQPWRPCEREWDGSSFAHVTRTLWLWSR